MVLPVDSWSGLALVEPVVEGNRNDVWRATRDGEWVAVRRSRRSELGVAEQQIQRYEASDYRSTSLARLCDVANALGVAGAQHAELTASA